MNLPKIRQWIYEMRNSSEEISVDDVLQILDHLVEVLIEDTALRQRVNP